MVLLLPVGMARVKRSNAEPDESADVTMTETTSNNIKKRILNDVQIILNVDDETNRILNKYLRNTLLMMKLLLNKKIRKKAAENIFMKIILIKIENKFSKIEKQNANLSTKMETYASVIRATVTIVKQTININARSKNIAITLTETRKVKEILIKVENDVEKHNVREASNKNILKRIKKRGEEHAKKAATIK